MNGRYCDEWDNIEEGTTLKKVNHLKYKSENSTINKEINRIIQQGNTFYN